TYRGSTLPLKIAPAVVTQLKTTSQREGVTLFMTSLAAFQVLLARYTGESEIVVGTPIANRTRAETEDLIGFFVNTLPMRVSVRGDESWGQLLARVREVCLGAYAHQDVPFEKLVEELQPERALSHHALFQVMLVWQNAPQGSLELAGLNLSAMPAHTTQAKFDLTLSLEETGAGELLGTIEYSSDLFEAETIERLSTHYQRLLAELARDTGQLISQTQMLSEAEREQVLVEWNQTAREYAPRACLHELIEAQ